MHLQILIVPRSVHLNIAYVVLKLYKKNKQKNK